MVKWAKEKTFRLTLRLTWVTSFFFINVKCCNFYSLQITTSFTKLSNWSMDRILRGIVGKWWHRLNLNKLVKIIKRWHKNCIWGYFAMILIWTSNWPNSSLFGTIEIFLFFIDIISRSIFSRHTSKILVLLSQKNNNW